MGQDFAESLSAALFYRSLGLVPVPSRMDDKRPLGSYKLYRSQSVPECVYSERKWQTGNLQILTGVATSGQTKILVVDLDGPEAKQAWKRLCRLHDYRIEAAWLCETGSGGIHLYFSIPKEAKACPSRLIWGIWDSQAGVSKKGGWAKHKEIRLLGDESLAVAPPSRHVLSGKPYRWLRGWSPREFPLPAEAPVWLLSIPQISSPAMNTIEQWKDRPPLRLAEGTHRSPPSFLDHEQRREAVLKSISPQEKMQIARLWGLRLTGLTHGEWAQCRAIDREDTHPSASLNLTTGVYHDFATSRKLSFFDLGVELGAFPDFRSAIETLGNYAKV